MHDLHFYREGCMVPTFMDIGRNVFISISIVLRGQHRAQFYGILDPILSEIGSGFNQPKLKFLSKLEEMFLRPVNGVSIDHDYVNIDTCE